MKIFVHTKVNLHGPTLEPASSSFGEFDRFGNLNHSQEVAKKVPRRFLFLRWHCNLKMVNCNERSGIHTAILTTKHEELTTGH